MGGLSDNEVDFVDRRGNHSINVMLVCSPDVSLCYVNASRSGSVNNALVLRNSRMYSKLEEGWRPIDDSLIFGGSAYPVRSWLFPPVSQIQNDEIERLFLRA